MPAFGLNMQTKNDLNKEQAKPRLVHKGNMEQEDDWRTEVPSRYNHSAFFGQRLSYVFAGITLPSDTSKKSSIVSERVLTSIEPIDAKSNSREKLSKGQRLHFRLSPAPSPPTYYEGNVKRLQDEILPLSSSYPNNQLNVNQPRALSRLGDYRLQTAGSHDRLSP
ncbi:hypothetical protein K431DRAFT_292569 [Polychaeton citri CBS 116435]|uniref:Uncharacterized protein n=1 Tax=Polychaeton citri CBS 116435 TaxID=1314669 RepID=A0A9P4QD76_9PEZI|nr:hypothetical protein K431DRAFT_292569 [Polychaeton citri CBS 116435]